MSAFSYALATGSSRARIFRCITAEPFLSPLFILHFRTLLLLFRLLLFHHPLFLGVVDSNSANSESLSGIQRDRRVSAKEASDADDNDDDDGNDDDADGNDDDGDDDDDDEAEGNNGYNDGVNDADVEDDNDGDNKEDDDKE